MGGGSEHLRYLWCIKRKVCVCGKSKVEFLKKRHFFKIRRNCSRGDSFSPTLTLPSGHPPGNEPKHFTPSIVSHTTQYLQATMGAKCCSNNHVEGSNTYEEFHDMRVSTHISEAIASSAAVMPITIAVIGNRGVGKSTLVKALQKTPIHSTTTPAVHTIKRSIRLQNEPVGTTVIVQDWPGNWNPSLNLRLWQQVDAFIICFDKKTTHRTSLKEHVDAVMQHCPNANFMLAQCKSENIESCAGFKDNMPLGKKLKAAKIKCSAISGQNVQVLLDSAISLGLAARRKTLQHLVQSKKWNSNNFHFTARNWVYQRV